MKTRIRMLAVSLAVALSPMALALSSGGLDGQVTKLDATAANRGQALVATKIASNFTTLAGSKDNSLALVNALRTGATVNLVTTTTTPGINGVPDVVTTTTTTFDPPTGKMGWGNVKISLALAQDALARAGVASPTAEQLQAALVGGDLVITNADGTTSTRSLTGVLTQRASGMGWGEIAQANGTKVGPVVSQLKMAHTRVASIPPEPQATTKALAPSSAARASGITTAAGASANAGGKGSKGLTPAAGAPAPGAANGQGKGLTTAAGSTVTAGSHGKGHGAGAGITTAMGGGAVTHAPKGHGSGQGIVSAGGAHASPLTRAGGGNAGGNGKGQGKGGGKPGG
jgi:hypothetical protein